MGSIRLEERVLLGRFRNSPQLWREFDFFFFQLEFWWLTDNVTNLFWSRTEGAWCHFCLVMVWPSQVLKLDVYVCLPQSRSFQTPSTLADMAKQTGCQGPPRMMLGKHSVKDNVVFFVSGERSHPQVAQSQREVILWDASQSSSQRFQTAIAVSSQKNKVCLVFAHVNKMAQNLHN